MKRTLSLILSLVLVIIPMLIPKANPDVLSSDRWNQADLLKFFSEPDEAVFIKTGTESDVLFGDDGHNFLLESSITQNKYVMLCADVHLYDPSENDEYVVKEREDNTIPALACALAYQGFTDNGDGGITDEEFFAMLETQPETADIAKERLSIMQDVIWDYYSGINNNTILNKMIAQAKSGTQTQCEVSYVLDDQIPHGLTVNVTYTGYVPTHKVQLTWTDDGENNTAELASLTGYTEMTSLPDGIKGVEFTVGNDSGEKTYAIEFTNISGTINFEFNDDAPYLKIPSDGSEAVKGAKLIMISETEDPEAYQELIIGYAEFLKFADEHELTVKGNAEIKIKKTVEYHKQVPSFEFTFILERVTDETGLELHDDTSLNLEETITLYPKSNDASSSRGETLFELNGLLPDTYYFKISEKPDKDWTQIKPTFESYIVKIVVDYDGSVKYSTFSADGEEAELESIPTLEFENRYTPFLAKIKILKAINGGNLKEGEYFTFDLTEIDENGVPIPDGRVMSKTITGPLNEESAPLFTIDKLPYSKIYYFKITERDMPGWNCVTPENDEKSYIVKVEVKANGTVEYSVDNGTPSTTIPALEFVNEYIPSKANAEIIVKKTLANAGIEKGEKFTFNLKEIDKDGVTVPDGKSMSIDIEGPMSASEPKYGKFEIPGLSVSSTYYYRITEQSNTNWSCDKSTYIVRVVVDADGEVAYFIDNSETGSSTCELAFLNTYTTTTTTEPTTEYTTTPTTEYTTTSTTEYTTTPTTHYTTTPTTEYTTLTTETTTTPSTTVPSTTTPTTETTTPPPTEPTLEEVTEEITTGEIPKENITFPEETTPEEVEVETPPVPLASFPPSETEETPKDNPKTSDNIYMMLGLLTLTITSGIIFKKRLNKNKRVK